MRCNIKMFKVTYTTIPMTLWETSFTKHLNIEEGKHTKTLVNRNCKLSVVEICGPSSSKVG